jgi:hypothetical protein
MAAIAVMIVSFQDFNWLCTLHYRHFGVPEYIKQKLKNYFSSKKQVTRAAIAEK